LFAQKKMSLSFYWLLLGTLAVWRVTHLLTAEAGPWDVFLRLRRLVGGGFWSTLINCFYCLSLWVAVPFAYLIGERSRERILLWLAFSGAAILLERATSRTEEIPPAAYTEDEEEKEEEKNVLRQR
jgi:type VI protein secretion system component VasK